MHTVRELLESKRGRVVTIAPDASVYDALELMAERNIGAACVLEADRLVGIVSERDMMNRVIAAGRDPKGTRVRDVMTSKPIVVEASETHERCLKVMQQAKIRHLPVIDGDRLLGVISLRDLLKVDADSKAEELKHMQDYIHYVPPSTPQV